MANAQCKPKKPYPSFPLTAHPNGQWCKKIRGQVRFFGVWGDPEGALRRYRAVAADLHAGRTPRRVSSLGLTVKDACNAFLRWQKDKLDASEIGPRWFEDCRKILAEFAGRVGKSRLVEDLRPEDLQTYRSVLAKRLGVHALTRHITVIRSVFKHAYDADLIERPMRFGAGFRKPTAAQVRKARGKAEVENGKKLFTSDDVIAILTASNGWLRTAVLLGINGGFGNTDCARLPWSAVDLEGALITYSRPKTGVERIVPLWPEATAALRAVRSSTPAPIGATADGLVFATVRGFPLVRQIVRQDYDTEGWKVTNVDEVSTRFAAVLKALDKNRRGVGFYTLRHTFRTWADETHDQHAIHWIMGHAIPGMSGVYIEEIGLDRLRAVVDHVRAKLFVSQ